MSEDMKEQIAAALPVTRGEVANGTLDEPTAYTLLKADHGPKRLSAKASPFRSTGVCYLTVTRNGERIQEDVPIRSVPQAIERQIRKETLGQIPQAPYTRELNRETMEYVRVYDENDPKYLEQVTEFTNLFIKRFVVQGLDCILEDLHGAEVWNPVTGEGSWQKAVDVLEDMGWTSDQIAYIREQIAELTQSDAQIEERERRKKSL